MKKILSVLLILILSITVLTGCGGDNGGENSFGDTLRVGSIGDISTMDPTNFSDLQTQLAITAVYSRLVKFDKDLKVIPDAAEHWENISDLEWGFTLKEGIKFSDGTDLTAEDVKASLMRAKTQTLVAHIVAYIEDVDIKDDLHFVIKTSKPFAALLSNLADPACSILPSELIESGNDFAKNPVGSGPYVFESWTPSEKAVFVRNENYFDTENASQFEKLELRVIPEGSSRTIALETGEIDINTSVLTSDYSRIKENEKLGLYETTANQLYGLFFNETKEPFNNLDFRKAIEYAVDKEAVIQASQEGLGERLTSILPSAVVGSIDAGYTYDVEKAKEYLQKSGFKQEAGKKFVIRSMSDMNTKMAVVIQGNLKDIGIETEVAQNTVATHMEQCGQGQFEMAIMGWATAPDPDRFLRPLFHKDSLGTNNFSQLKDDEISKKIDDAVGIIDETKRKAAYEEINRELMDEAHVVPITGKAILIGYRAGLKNVYQDGVFGMDFNTIRY